LRLFILPHVVVGMWLLGQMLLTIAWAIGGQDLSGRIVAAQDELTRKGNHVYTITYEYEQGVRSGKGRTKVGESFYSALPESLRLHQPGAETAPLPLRVFRLGPIIHVVPMLGARGILGEILAVTLGAMFWNGILSAFVYKLWIQPFRDRRSGRRR
jgi:hypothetical protein